MPGTEMCVGRTLLSAALDVGVGVAFGSPDGPKPPKAAMTNKSTVETNVNGSGQECSLYTWLGQRPQSFLDQRQRRGRLGPGLANPDRRFEDGSHRYDAAQLVRRYGCQAHGCDAAA